VVDYNTRQDLEAAVLSWALATAARPAVSRHAKLLLSLLSLSVSTPSDQAAMRRSLVRQTSLLLQASEAGQRLSGSLSCIVMLLPGTAPDSLIGHVSGVRAGRHATSRTRGCFLMCGSRDQPTSLTINMD
jgi:hypothetical protein